MKQISIAQEHVLHEAKSRTPECHSFVKKLPDPVSVTPFPAEMINPDSVEEADVELCASGFDNLLMEQGQVEFRSYHEMLVEMGALKCATIVKELLDWIDEAPDQYAIDVVERDKGRYNNLWRRYDAASCEEKPQELARSRQ